MSNSQNSKLLKFDYNTICDHHPIYSFGKSSLIRLNEADLKLLNISLYLVRHCINYTHSSYTLTKDYESFPLDLGDDSI